jgi:hypothetical protein
LHLERSHVGGVGFPVGIDQVKHWIDRGRGRQHGDGDSSGDGAAGRNG